ncbi:uncharacterized protein LOC106163699 [Lingula anatina]|uniref:Uncharacterized protein LOC106163699 n=1 Tax=Lingula anatina TaxID=7574 RepID=A0A1S3IG24_LINAN|nr:uncharacterized protein LOC106163699 [Lingula anatina]|eukprot:XP_013396816.1 uncharacterized protein LOC106163699 [Lingula anatina]
MKRAEICEALAPLKIVDYPEVPPPPPKGVVVKITYSGVCHSDVHIWEDEMDMGDGVKMKLTAGKFIKFPLAPGHEIAGIIEAVGSEAGSEVKVGDAVVVYPWLACLQCDLCTHGQPNLCLNAVERIGAAKHGGFATHVVVPITSGAVVKIPEGLAPEVACMVPCSGITTYNAVLKTKEKVTEMVRMKGNAKLLIIGAGGLGMWCIQFAKALLPPETRVFSADISEEKLQMAKEANADDTILWSKDANEQEILAQTMQRSGGVFDAVIDLVGAGATSQRAFNLTERGGIQVNVGLFGGNMKIPLIVLALHTKCVQGVCVGAPHHLEDCLKLVAEKKLKPPPLEFFTLDQATEALTRLKEGTMKGRGILKL